MACFNMRPHGFHAVLFETTVAGALAFSFTAGCGSEKRGGGRRDV